MKITKEILQALEEIRAVFGNYAELSDRTGVPRSTISRIVNGTTTTIEDHTWDKLAPLIVPYLDDTAVRPHGTGEARRDTIANTAELRECIKDRMLRSGVRNSEDLRHLIRYDSGHTIDRLLAGKLNWFPDILSAVFHALKIDYDDAPITAKERELLLPDAMIEDGAILVRPIPVVDWANAADYVSSLVGEGKAISWHWDPEVTETIPAPVGVRKGTVALRVNGASMEPKIIDGDRLFCEPVPSFAEVPNGKVIVAKFLDSSAKCPGCIVCKRMRRIHGANCLISDNPSGKSFDDVKDTDVSWLGVVVGKYSDDI